MLGSFRTPPVTSRRETNWLLHWLWAHSGKALEAPRCLGVRRRLGGCWHKTEKGNRAVRPCPGGAAHARGGEKLGLKQRGSEAPAILFNGALLVQVRRSVCNQGGRHSGTGCRKNGELETRGKWELPGAFRGACSQGWRTAA